MPTDFLCLVKEEVTEVLNCVDSQIPNFLISRNALRNITSETGEGLLYFKRQICTRYTNIITESCGWSS
jgi:hypothetical protein